MICMGISVSPAKENITSIQQLNDPSCTVAVSESGAAFSAVKRDLPKANIIYASGQQGYDVVKMEKADAYAFDRIQMEIAIANGLTGVKILPGSIGEKVEIAVGLSRASKIPELKRKVNQFISEIKASGIFQDMYQRWVINGQYIMPDIDTHSSSGKKLVIGTIGLVMPYSFYEGNTLTGFDIELGRRLASWLGTEIEFRIYDYGGLIAAAHTGEIDCIMANLNYTPERAEKIDFSDTLFTEETALIVKGNNPQPKPEIPSAIKDFDGKRIAVFTGTSHAETVKELLPSAKLFYFDSNANGIAALTSGKVDALVNDDAILREIVRENPSLTCVDEYLKRFDNAFIFAKTSNGDKLRNEINEFIRTLKSEGTLTKMLDVWTGNDESLRTLPDYEDYPDTNGTLKIAVDFDNPPFNYIKDGKLVGYDVDIIVRFCESKGYRPEFSGMDFSAIVPYVFSGKGDIGIGAITITEERKESVNFSEPVYTGGAMLLIMKPVETQKSPTSSGKYTRILDLDGKKMGVQTGVDEWAKMTKSILPHAEIVYFNTYADILAALEAHKIEAFMVSHNTFNLMAAENSRLAKFDERVDADFDIAFGFAKTNAGKKLSDEVSEFLLSLKASGELQRIVKKWEGADESAKTLPDYKNFPAPKGILSFATEGEYPPYNYYRGTEIAGLDIDLAARFCEAYGYGLKITSMAYDSIIPALTSGKYDFAGELAPAEEHEESLYFSEPYCKSYTVVACLKSALAVNVKSKYTSIDDFAGKKIGVQAGTRSPEVAKKLVPTAELFYYDTPADNLLALRSGKIDAACMPESAAKFLMYDNDDVVILGGKLTNTKIASLFSKTEKGKKLCKEYEEFVKSLWDDGTIDKINSVWFGRDENKRILKDYSKLPATNGTLKMAVDTAMPPMVYVKDNKIIGYDIDIAVRFCEAKGYALKVVPMSFQAVIPAVQSGKCDFSCGMTCTPERAESVLFSSTPNIEVGSVMLIRKSDAQEAPAKSYSGFATIADLAGKRIAVLTGSTHPDITLKFVPTAKLVYFDTIPDTFTALKTNKVDAVCTGIPMARLVMIEDNSIAFFGEQLTHTECAPIFAKTENGRKLCDEFSEFFKAQWENGTINEIDSIWFGKDDSKKVIKDYSSFPAPNGVLKMAADVSMPPCVYVKDNMIVGYDVDCVVRFCEAYGYGLEIVPMNFNGVIPAVQTGKCDFGICGITRTDEREESVLFSYPNVKTGNAFVVRKSDIAPDVQKNSGRYTSLYELERKKIGVQTGTTSARLVAERLPNAQIEYFDALSDILIALKTGKIDALACTIFAATDMMNHNDDVIYLDEWLKTSEISPIFTKSDKGKKLCEEYGEFVKSLWTDGTISTLKSIWLGKDDSKKIVKDYSNLPAPNGILKMGVDTSWPPLAYVKDNRIVGYDIDIAVRFCEAKGYGLEIFPSSVSGMIAAVQSGKCDFSQSVNVTEERAQIALFSPTPTAKSGNVIVVMKSELQSDNANSGQYTRLQDLSGKKVGIILGANHDIFVAEKIPTAKIEYFNDLSAITLALQTGKIDAFTNTLPTAIYMTHEHKDMSYVSEPLENTYTYSAFTNSDKGHKVCDEYAEFIKSLWDDGTIKRLSDKWIFSENEQLRTMEDYSKLSADNGILRMAIDTGRMPFAYVKDNKITGYDIEIAAMFCKSKGYGLEVYPMDFAGILGSIKTGKCDLTGSITRTEERAETMLFSPVPNAETPIVLIVMKSPAAEQNTSAKQNTATENFTEEEKNIFFDELKASFERTFIREDRWKLFADGIVSTMIITVLSILFGTILGFLVYLSCRGGNIIANLITRFFVWLIQGMPMVVLLMILYYIIFGKVDIAGIWVAVIAFSLTFGAGVYGMLLSGVNALDKGQLEAAYALGFTDRRAFFTIILPQAALHFMPAYKGEVVALIKATAIVGYIAVQDLTKMGDIVRSRTYEAFFPLIAVAVIYFVLAGLLNVIVGIIHNRIRPEKRTKSDILRGIEIHD